MTEFILLGIFSLALLGCVIGNLPILLAMTMGFFLFFGYGLQRGHSCPQLCQLAFAGIRTVQNILLTFLLIGIITAFWRAGGTIPFIVYYAASLCSPSLILLMSFLLCCLVSVLTGTAFGSAATMGVICMTMANCMGADPLYTGGAILAGVYFGDRCSPMSTSALLVSALTGTDLFTNIRIMLRTAWCPFAITCIIYGILGLSMSAQPAASQVQDIFAASFQFHPFVLVPAILIIALSFFHLDVKRIMGLSILTSGAAAIFIQQMPVAALLQISLTGYHPPNAELAALLSGGGIVSMLNVFAIVCLSACYAGLFAGTGFLDGIQKQLTKLSHRVTPFGAVLLTSLLTGCIACNQSLTILLTHQLCQKLEPDAQRFASYLENTAVVTAPLIPWSIASAVPLASVAAPAASILAAAYLYLLPLWSYYNERKQNG